MKIGILGTGSWATALAQVLCDNNQEVIMKGITANEVNEINEKHLNSTYFPGIAINKNIKATLKYEDISDVDLLLFGVPVIALRQVAIEVEPFIRQPIPMINVAKGFDPVSKDRLSLTLKEIFKNKAEAVISLIGPSHAEEVIQRKLTCINSVCADEQYAKYVQNLFANNYFRVYRNRDESGAEIAAAVKNIMAIASGTLAGLGQGINATAALMTRGLAEMSRYGLFYGGKKETFLGLNGVGDLIVTCSSALSRNYQAGLSIGKADDAKNFLASNKKTTEGILTTKTVYLSAVENNIEMPITQAVYEVLYEYKKPSQVIKQLMNRPLKEED